jgi:hypothetical protein
METLYLCVKFKIKTIMSYNNLKKVYLEKYKITVIEDGTIIGVLGRPIYGEIDKHGYRRISVFYEKNGIKIRKHKFVHRLVAEAFLDNYSKNLVTNHKDCNKLNNHYNNLEMCTISQNTQHTVDNNLLKVKGEDCIFNKYSEEFVRAILTKLKDVKRLPNGNIKSGELIKIAEELNTTRQVVKNYSRRRQIWTHLDI